MKNRRDQYSGKRIRGGLTAPLNGMTFFDRLLTRTALGVLSLLARVREPEGLDYANDPLVFIMNHSNYSETLLLAAFLLMKRKGRPVSFLVDWMFGEFPVASGVLKRLGSIFVYNKRARWKFVDRRRPVPPPYRAWVECVRVLRRGGSVALFPEGRANPDPYVLLKARRGLGRILKETGAMVIPIGIRYVKQRQGKVPKLGRMTLGVGEPFFPSSPDEGSIHAHGDPEHTDSNPADLLGHRCMEVLASLCGKAYPHRPVASGNQTYPNREDGNEELIQDPGCKSS
ncbi:MAG: hypothetical protein GF388_06055 [Candidatus Aegiribacteria sp.]|nr:hypothetical protein [Candidatus Aegiribacteria sp.]MBD3294736.1 hypothetical protein [Candidatus Fermentibacteria bacterium]